MKKLKFSKKDELFLEKNNLAQMEMYKYGNEFDNMIEESKNKIERLEKEIEYEKIKENRMKKLERILR
jgi:hypothetical protein